MFFRKVQRLQTKSLNFPKILEGSIKIILFDKLTFHQTPPQNMQNNLYDYRGMSDRSHTGYLQCKGENAEKTLL